MRGEALPRGAPPPHPWGGSGGKGVYYSYADATCVLEVSPFHSKICAFLNKLKRIVKIRGVILVKVT